MHMVFTFLLYDLKSSDITAVFGLVVVIYGLY